MTLESEFNDFIASGILDQEENEFEEYETCIVSFDDHVDHDRAAREGDRE